ncbi:unnamed protein product [Ixodes pacificus]
MPSEITAEAVSADPRLQLMPGDVAGRPSPPPFELRPARQERRLLCIPGGRRPRWNGQAGVPRVSAIEITKLTVPRVVESGLEGPFDLDCQYRCNESDSKLVVKWFFNGEPQPFYQWIAEMQKPVIGERSADTLGVARLVTLIPSICPERINRCEKRRKNQPLGATSNPEVSTPPSTFHFNYTKSSSDRATLLCEVDGAFPMPHLKMYRLLVDSEDDQAELVNVQLTTERKEGYYRAVMTSEVMDNALPQDEATVFLCSYSFKEIKYQRLKRLTYMPARPDPAEKQSGGSVNLGCGVRARLSLPFPDVGEHRPSNPGQRKRREWRVLKNPTPPS